MAAGCTSVRSGNFYGRSFDYTLTESVEFLIRTPHTDSRFASVGVAIGNCKITEDILGENGKGLNETEEKLLPFTNLDGINEKGVIANSNVVPAKDLKANCDDGKYHTTGTNPGKEDLFYQFVVRYVLDNAKSASHAIELLGNVNITGANSKGQVVDYQGLCEIGYELHWMIADENDTYIVELLDNELHVLHNEKFAMANYYSSRLTDSSAGVERYQTCMDNYDTANTKDGMTELMKKLRYSTLYYPGGLRPSELSGQTLPDGTHITVSNVNDLLGTDAVKAGVEKFAETNRQILDNNDRTHGASAPWISVHAEVYDIGAKTMYLMTQEQYDRVFEYSLS